MHFCSFIYNVKRIVIAKTEQILFLFFQQLLQQAIQTTPSIRPSQLQAQGGFFSGNILIIKATLYIALFQFFTLSIQQGLHSNHILMM